MAERSALVVGVTGIQGHTLASQLNKHGWNVTGLARRKNIDLPGVTGVSVDLTARDAVQAALHGTHPTHIFFNCWSRQATEAENCVVNGAILRNLLEAVEDGPQLQHVALVTGLKHYMGPFEAYALNNPDTPFREEQERLPYENFYYTQEDILFESASRSSFTWSVHRPHTVIGWAIGNAMNMGLTLAVYGSICRETGRDFVFPGSPEQYEAVTDVTDARILARQLEWAATERSLRIKLSISSTVTFFDGNGCGRSWPPGWVSRLRTTRESRRRWCSRWQMRAKSGTTSWRSTTCNHIPSRPWLHGGIRMPTSDGLSKPSPICRRVVVWVSLNIKRLPTRSSTCSIACARNASSRLSDEVRGTT